MELQYIEKEGKQLYSVYNPPKALINNEVGIILCFPFGQEYIRCHKLYLNLASKLSLKGFHVLRFDYHGTGDSSGDCADITIDESLKDIKLAIEELKEACDVSKIVLVGVRFGATLSLLFSSKYKTDALILWNPVFNGKRYLEEIDRDYIKWLNGSFTKEKKTGNKDLSNFGFLFHEGLINQIKTISIDKSDFNEDMPVLLIDEEDHLGVSSTAYITFEKAINKEYWMKRENELNKSMVPIYELNKTIEWINDLFS